MLCGANMVGIPNYPLMPFFAHIIEKYAHWQLSLSRTNSLQFDILLRM